MPFSEKMQQDLKVYKLCDVLFFVIKKQNSTKLLFTIHAILQNETYGFEPHLCYSRCESEAHNFEPQLCYPRCDNRFDEYFHFHGLLC